MFYSSSHFIWLFFMTSIFFLVMIIYSSTSLNIFIKAVLKCLPISLSLSFLGLCLWTDHFILAVGHIFVFLGLPINFLLDARHCVGM